MLRLLGRRRLLNDAHISVSSMIVRGLQNLLELAPTSLTNLDFQNRNQQAIFSRNNMSIEGALTRDLDIRFIDARMLALEAKVNLGVEGYHSPEQQEQIIEEALKIFAGRPDEVRKTMLERNTNLEAAKKRERSNSEDTDLSEHSTHSATSSVKSHGRKKFNIWPVRRVNSLQRHRSDESNIWPVRRLHSLQRHRSDETM